MKSRKLILWFVVAWVMLQGGPRVFLSDAIGQQQVTVTSPKHHVGDSFSESIGTSWGLSGKNWFFNYGGSGVSKTPAFGNHNPGMGLQTGRQFHRKGVNGYINAWAGHGTERFASSEVPTVTMMNGEQAYFGDVSTTPFVVGVTPVVGGWYGNAPPSPFSPYYASYMNVSPQRGNQTVQEALQRLHNAQNASPNATSDELYRAALGTPPRKKRAAAHPDTEINLEPPTPRSVNRGTNTLSAETPALSVAEMRKLNQAQKQQEYQQARDLVKRGKSAEKGGNSRLAKSLYKEAIPLAEPKLQDRIREHLTKMD